MAESKMCPLKFYPENFEYMRCGRDACSWWDNVNSMCCVTSFVITAMEWFETTGITTTVIDMNRDKDGDH